MYHSWPATRVAWAVRIDYQDYGYDSDYGVGGYACMLNMARYVSVAPRDVSTESTKSKLLKSPTVAI